MNYILHSSGEQPLSKHVLQMERHIVHQEIGCVQRNIIVFGEKGFLQFFWSQDDITLLNEKGKRFLNKKKAQQLFREGKKSVEEYWKQVGNLKGAVEKRNDSLILKSYKNYVNAILLLYSHFINTTGQMTASVEERLINVTKKEFPATYREVFEILTTSTDEDLLVKEKKEWIKLQKNITDKKIISHAKKYSFLLSNMFSEKDVLEWARMKEKNIRELKDEVNQSEKRRKSVQKRQHKLLKIMKSKDARHLSWVVQEGPIIRLQQKACWGGESFHLLPFFEYVAEKAKCSVRDLYFFYTPEEVMSLLEEGKPLPQNELERRKKNILLIFSYPKITLYSGNLAIKKKKELLDPYIEKQESTLIKGMTACKGNVKGQIKIINVDNPLMISQIAKKIHSDIIIATGMTNPTMIPIIRKCKGIITDEGGISCHAAIISREFNIPCIVGCHSATLVLKDGDYVVLNANEGIVKKITKEEYMKI